MKSKQHTKKAVTLLTKIETLLSDVLEECSAIEKSVEKNVGVLLRSAEVSIAAAKDYFIAPEPPKIRRKIAKTSAHALSRRKGSAHAPVTARRRAAHGAGKAA